MKTLCYKPVRKALRVISFPLYKMSHIGKSVELGKRFVVFLGTGFKKRVEWGVIPKSVGFPFDVSVLKSHSDNS